MWVNVGQYGLILVNVDQYGSIWDNVGQYGSMWVNITPARTAVPATQVSPLMSVQDIASLEVVFPWNAFKVGLGLGSGSASGLGSGFGFGFGFGLGLGLGLINPDHQPRVSCMQVGVIRVIRVTPTRTCNRLTHPLTIVLVLQSRHTLRRGTLTLTLAAVHKDGAERELGSFEP